MSTEARAGLKIVAAAVRRDGVVFTGIRHGHIVQQMADLGVLDHPGARVTYEQQGFLTSRNEFVGRERAAAIAEGAGQIEPDERRRELFSEDLW